MHVCFIWRQVGLKRPFSSPDVFLARSIGGYSYNGVEVRCLAIDEQ